MPELPEAQANRMRVEEHCLHRTIVAAGPGANVTYIELPGDNERQRLVGKQFTQTRRHGKMIFAGSKAGPWVGVHLGMTGKLIPFDEGDEPPPDPKFVITFEGDRRLAFLDKRKLGWFKVLDDPDAFIAAEGYGPDALALSQEEFARIVGGTRGAVKATLMDQHKLAGIGNLWSDEICFQTGILPTHGGADLPEGTLNEMFRAMRTALGQIIADKLDYGKLPADWLVHHRQKGADCPRCGGTIEARTVAGRTAYFCARHQE